MLAAKFIIVFGVCITQSNPCVIFEMYQGKCEGPMYYQQYGPTETGLNLFNCAQHGCRNVQTHCLRTRRLCTSGTRRNRRVRDGNVFTPKRPILMPGEFEWILKIRPNLLQGLWHMLWILFSYVLVMLTSLIWLFLHIFGAVSLVMGECQVWSRAMGVTPTAQSTNLIHTSVWELWYLFQNFTCLVPFTHAKIIHMCILWLYLNFLLTCHTYSCVFACKFD